MPPLAANCCWILALFPRRPRSSWIAPTRAMKPVSWRWTWATFPPKSNRLNPWEYDRVLYRKRNEVERLFRRLKGFRRVFSRFDKLDVMFTGFVHFALIVESLRLC